MKRSIWPCSPRMPSAAYRAPTSGRTRSTITWSTRSTDSSAVIAAVAASSASSRSLAARASVRAQASSRPVCSSWRARSSRPRRCPRWPPRPGRSGPSASLQRATSRPRPLPGAASAARPACRSRPPARARATTRSRTQPPRRAAHRDDAAPSRRGSACSVAASGCRSQASSGVGEGEQRQAARAAPVVDGRGSRGSSGDVGIGVQPTSPRDQWPPAFGPRRPSMRRALSREHRRPCAIPPTPLRPRRPAEDPEAVSGSALILPRRTFLKGAAVAAGGAMAATVAALRARRSPRPTWSTAVPALDRRRSTPRAWTTASRPRRTRRRAGASGEPIPEGWTEHDMAAREKVRRFVGNLAAPARPGRRSSASRRTPPEFTKVPTATSRSSRPWTGTSRCST